MILGAKRLIPQLRQQFPKMGLIITGDDLFSRQPMIEYVQDQKFHFFFVAKPTSHKYMMQWLNEYGQLHEYRETDKRGRTILYQWMNDIPLHGEKNAIRVNYFCKKLLSTDLNGEDKVYRTQSWVSDLEATRNNVVLFTCGAKSRWKIENECCLDRPKTNALKEILDDQDSKHFNPIFKGDGPTASELKN